MHIFTWATESYSDYVNAMCLTMEAQGFRVDAFRSGGPRIGKTPWRASISKKPSMVTSGLALAIGKKEDFCMWVDADMLLVGDLGAVGPGLTSVEKMMDEASADIAIPVRPSRGELLSSIIIMRTYSSGVARVMYRWENEMKRNVGRNDQEVLSVVLDEAVKDGTIDLDRILILGPRWAWIAGIYEREHPNVRPLFYALQASRKMADQKFIPGPRISWPWKENEHGW